MGIRLVVQNSRKTSGTSSGGTFDHREMLNRDAINQHPINAITGLQEVLNTIELNISNILDSIDENNKKVLKDANDYTDIQINNINNLINDINNQIDINFIKTNSIDINKQDNNISADLIISKDNTNALKILQDGAYVQKWATKESDTISWYNSANGEPIQYMLEYGSKFSHKTDYKNIYTQSEADAWTTIDDKVTNPLKTNTFTGLISNDDFASYKHLVKLSSNSNTNNGIGVIIGFVFDSDNKPHTLSALIQPGGSAYYNYKFGLFYDFCNPDMQLINNYNILNCPTTWQDNFIYLYINKNFNNISISITDWNKELDYISINDIDLNDFQYTYDIDLDNYSFGYLFDNIVKYGYGVVSQAYPYYENILFYSDNYQESNAKQANVKISQESGNSLILKSDGLYAQSLPISSKENNAIVYQNDGYYVENKEINISSQDDNGIQTKSDGFYVHQSHSFITVNQANHGLSIGDWIYYDKTYQKGLAEDSKAINIIGLVTKVIDNNNFEFICNGYVKTDYYINKEYEIGLPLYISDKVPGKATQVQPDISKAIGYLVKDGIVISIERGIQYNNMPEIGDFKVSANTYNIRSDGFIRIIEDIDYKASIVGELLSVLSQDFKDNYISIDETKNTISFINTEQLYLSKNVTEGDYLFIKAF